MHHDTIQSQVTRLCLIGKGIACGLDICVDGDFGVYIQAGNGITSNGDYIEVSESKWFRFFKPYTNEEYSLFQGLSLWELTDESCDEPLKPQSSEDELNPFLRDKVVLVYKEKTLDEQGQEIISYRFLLMNQQDVLDKMNLTRLTTQILWQQQGDDEDFIYNDDYNPDDTRPRIHTLNLAMNPALRLPELYLQRFGFSSGDPFDCPPEGVDTSVFPPITNLDDLYNAYIPIIDKATFELDKVLCKLNKDFQALLDCKNIAQFQEWIDLLCEKWEAFKNENEEEDIGKKYYIQYFYDWVRDLIQAYNELREKIIKLMADCCGDSNDFPCHLLLGIALRDDLSRQPKPLRHTFRQAPIYNGNADRLQCLRLYYWRAIMMIKGFYLPDYIQDENLNPFCEPNIQDDEDVPDFSIIKITPGRCYDQPLGKQSIPFYYPVTWGRYSVHHFWNLERTKTCSTNQLLSYHASDFDDSYTQLNHIIRPLHYSLNNYLFFRVEGHIGKHLNDIYRPDPEGDNGDILVKSGVISQLKYFKRKYNLPFCLKVFSIASQSDPPISYLTEQYEFPDLVQTLGVNYQLPDETEFFQSLKYPLLGAEHIAGAKAGGTLVLFVQNMETGEFDSNENPISDDVVIADFYLPCCQDDSEVVFVSADTNTSPPVIPENVDPILFAQTKPKKKSNSAEAQQPKQGKKTLKTKKILKPIDMLLAKLGQAKSTQKDNLQQIRGIGGKYEKQLNDLGIYNFEQVSKMTEVEYEIIDKLVGGIRGRGKRDNWAEQAIDLLKEK